MNTVVSLLLLYVFNHAHKDTYYEIARALLEKGEQVEHLSVTDFAMEIGTSVATVNKFCKEIGFSNFRTLKKQLILTRHGRLSQIVHRIAHTEEKEILDLIEFLVKSPIDRQMFLDFSKSVADRFHTARHVYLTGAVYPIGLALNFVEDMWMLDRPIEMINNLYSGYEGDIGPEDFCLMISDTGRSISLNRPYFLSLYTKRWDIHVVSQNVNFKDYDKISAFLPLPAHPENLDSPLVLAEMLNLIELTYYKQYGYKTIFTI